MPNRFVSRMLFIVIATAVALTAFAGSSRDSNGQPRPAPGPAIHTVLQSDLTLHSTFSHLLLQGTNDSGKTTLGFCLGGCGIRCATNADCGPGGQCRPFIICNDKAAKSEGVGLSSRRREMPKLNLTCK